MSTTRAVIATLVVCGVVGGVWFFVARGTPQNTNRPTEISGDVYTGAPLSVSYRNETYQFELSMPEGFSVSELPSDEAGGTAVLIQDGQGEGVQIYIVPAGDETELSAEAIQEALPGLVLENPETVEIGQEYRGVAFRSDNEAFGGASREVWFYFRGNLYQISTYARLDTLLKAMFATWRFF